MEQAYTSKFLEAVREGKEYIPIAVGSLRTDSITNFDIYLKAPRPGEPLVLYAERNIPFSEEARHRLEENRVEYVYIRTGQADDYRRYLERNLPDILSDESVAPEAKAEVLHMSAQGLVKEILDDPTLEGGILRSKEVVHNTVEFIFSDPSGLRHLIQSASYDYDRYAHSMNVCVLGIALVQREGFTDPRILKEFGTGALLRDVGMAQIDPAITESSGQLTVDQYEILKQHPLFGEQIVQEFDEVSDIVLDIVRHHHEALDGSGYPDGLRGEELNPLVRACTIADIFDALSTNRPGRPALSTFEALRVMGDEMREVIDMEMLRTFIDLMGNPG